MFTEPQLSAALAPADACGKAGELQPLVRQISDYLAVDGSRLDELDAVIRRAAVPAFMHFVMNFGNVTNGWSSTAAYPNFGDDFWFRATANFGGIWWNSSKEAVYELLHTDSHGEQTTGAKVYRMTFPADALPLSVVDAFWSLTVYGKPDYMLVPNHAGRYTVGSGHRLASDYDGSITLTFAPELPAHTVETNWLPTPQGKAFTADLRLYLPRTAVRTGEWKPPALEPVT